MGLRHADNENDRKAGEVKAVKIFENKTLHFDRHRQRLRCSISRDWYYDETPKKFRCPLNRMRKRPFAHCEASHERESESRLGLTTGAAFYFYRTVDVFRGTSPLGVNVYPVNKVSFCERPARGCELLEREQGSGYNPLIVWQSSERMLSQPDALKARHRVAEFKVADSASLAGALSPCATLPFAEYKEQGKGS